jgi:hypothetical protein
VIVGIFGKDLMKGHGWRGNTTDGTDQPGAAIGRNHNEKSLAADDAYPRHPRPSFFCLSKIFAARDEFGG